VTDEAGLGAFGNGALAVGAKTNIAMEDPGDARGVRSSDESIVHFDWQADRTILATAHAEGTADLIVVDDSGHEIDRLAVPTAKVARFDFKPTWPGGLLHPVPVMHDSAVRIDMKKYAGDGRYLGGTGAIAVTPTGAVMPATRASVTEPYVDTPDSFWFQLGAPGTASLAFDANSAHLAIDIAILADTDIATLEVHASPATVVVLPKLNVNVTLHLAAFTAHHDPVWGASPRLTLSDAKVAILPSAGGPGTHDAPLATSADWDSTVVVAGPGEVDVTAQLGTATATAHISATR
jgi:hypothetical protein